MDGRTLIWALFGMGRPIILLGVLMVHGAGVAMAFAGGYPLNASALAWGFVALFFVGLSVNYVNEYADYETDALTVKTRYSGGSGVLPSGRAPRRLALQAGWAALLLGLLIAVGGALAGVLPLPAVVVLILGGFGGWMYSLPPLKLAWNGLAETANAVLGGVVLPLYGYALLAGRLDWQVAAAFTPYALLIFNTAMATTWPDREADARVGKRTLATWMPVSRLRTVYCLAAVASFAVLLALPFLGIPAQVAVASLVALPAVIVAARQYTRALNPHATARASMMMVFAQTTAFFWLGASGGA